MISYSLEYVYRLDCGEMTCQRLTENVWQVQRGMPLLYHQSAGGMMCTPAEASLMAFCIKGDSGCFIHCKL